jgi:hypothetical protein
MQVVDATGEGCLKGLGLKVFVIVMAAAYHPEREGREEGPGLSSAEFFS